MTLPPDPAHETAVAPAEVASFTQPTGSERRYSVRFMEGLASRLVTVGLPDEQAAALRARLATLGRGGIEREGRLIDGILAGSNARAGLELYTALSRLGMLVTPGGTRVEPNYARSWTVVPPAGDPFVLENRPGLSRTLADGTTLTVERGDRLTAQPSEGAPLSLNAEDSRRLARVSVQSLTTSLAVIAAAAGGVGRAAGVVAGAVAAAGVAEDAVGGAATGGTAGAVGGIAAAAAAEGGVDGTAQVADGEVVGAAGEGAEGAVSRGLTAEAGATARQVPSAGAPPRAIVARDLTLRAITSMLEVHAAVFERLTASLAQVGQAVAPSRTSDPDAERATLLAAIARNAGRLGEEGVPGDVEALASRLRGAPRAAVIETLMRLLSSP